MDLITYVTDRKGHDMRYAIGSRKLQKKLGWEPSLQFEEGIEETVKWYLENQEWIMLLLGSIRSIMIICIKIDNVFFSKTYPSFLTVKEGCSKIIPSFFTIKEGSTSHPGPLSSGAREETALLGARNRFALRLADHQRSAPFYAGWDRLGKGGDLFNFKALAMVVRDGTAGGKGETEEYNYSLSIRLRSVFIFFP